MRLFVLFTIAFLALFASSANAQYNSPGYYPEDPRYNRDPYYDDRYRDPYYDDRRYREREGSLWGLFENSTDGYCDAHEIGWNSDCMRSSRRPDPRYNQYRDDRYRDPYYDRGRYGGYRIPPPPPQYYRDNYDRW